MSDIEVISPLAPGEIRMHCLHTIEFIKGHGPGEDGKDICQHCGVNAEQHRRHGLSPVEIPESRAPGKVGKIRGRIWEVEMKLHVVWYDKDHQVYDLIVDLWRAATQLYPHFASFPIHEIPWTLWIKSSFDPGQKLRLAADGRTFDPVSYHLNLHRLMSLGPPDMEFVVKIEGRAFPVMKLRDSTRLALPKWNPAQRIVWVMVDGLTAPVEVMTYVGEGTEDFLLHVCQQIKNEAIKPWELVVGSRKSCPEIISMNIVLPHRTAAKPLVLERAYKTDTRDKVTIRFQFPSTATSCATMLEPIQGEVNVYRQQSTELLTPGDGQVYTDYSIQTKIAIRNHAMRQLPSLAHVPLYELHLSPEHSAMINLNGGPHGVFDPFELVEQRQELLYEGHPIDLDKTPCFAKKPMVSVYSRQMTYIKSARVQKARSGPGANDRALREMIDIWIAKPWYDSDTVKSLSLTREDKNSQVYPVYYHVLHTNVTHCVWVGPECTWKGASTLIQQREMLQRLPILYRDTQTLLSPDDLIPPASANGPGCSKWPVLCRDPGSQGDESTGPRYDIPVSVCQYLLPRLAPGLAEFRVGGVGNKKKGGEDPMHPNLYKLGNPARE